MSWALAGAESVSVCKAGDGLTKLLREAGAWQTPTPNPRRPQSDISLCFFPQRKGRKCILAFTGSSTEKGKLAGN